MSLEFKINKPHDAKGYNKYPRTRINNLGGDKKAIIVANWHKFNWKEGPFGWKNRKLLIKFLKANIGRPIDKVFSEFLERCDNKLRKNSSLKEEFYSYIKRKEDISQYGGFYITNGILNYKKRKKNNNKI